MSYCVAIQSVIGRVRKNNEDNFCVNRHAMPVHHGDIPLLYNEHPDDRVLLVGVFDGMGGYNDGEEASFVAASTVGSFYSRFTEGEDFRALLEELCMEANRAVCKIAKGNKMGTTCALLCLHNGRYTVCNVGDSPVFLFRDGALHQISVDHNGKKTYEAATGKPAPAGKKFALTQCIGIPEEDMLIEPYIAEAELEPGDIFLLCSDGMTDMVTQGRIGEVMAACKEPKTILETLMAAALESGGRDNVTGICVKA